MAQPPAQTTTFIPTQFIRVRPRHNDYEAISIAPPEPWATTFEQNIYSSLDEEITRTRKDKFGKNNNINAHSRYRMYGKERSGIITLTATVIIQCSEDKCTKALKKSFSRSEPPYLRGFGLPLIYTKMVSWSASPESRHDLDLARSLTTSTSPSGSEMAPEGTLPQLNSDSFTQPSGPDDAHDEIEDDDTQSHPVLFIGSNSSTHDVVNVSLLKVQRGAGDARYAVAGGIVLHQNKKFAITTGHTFLADMSSLEVPNKSDDESIGMQSMSDTDTSDSEEGGGLSGEPSMARRPERHLTDIDFIQIPVDPNALMVSFLGDDRIGRLPSTIRSTPYGDWALVPISEDEVHKVQRLYQRDMLQVASEPGHVEIVCGSSQRHIGCSLPGTSFLQTLRGSLRVTEVRMYNPLPFTVSGCWVMNGQELLGYVVACSSDGLSCFMLSMEKVFDDIEQATGARPSLTATDMVLRSSNHGSATWNSPPVDMEAQIQGSAPNILRRRYERTGSAYTVSPRGRKRTASNASLQVPSKSRRGDSVSPRPSSGFATLKNAVSGLFASNRPDPPNSVLNSAIEATKPKPDLGRFFKGLASQSDRLGENNGLISSFIGTELFKGGYDDDRKYQMEQIVRLAASLPEGSAILDELTTKFSKLLWNNFEHPPLSFHGKAYKYRQADGSNNNIIYPHLGKAGSFYARTVTPKTLQPGALPDPGVIFDTVFARHEQAREHPGKISSMLFYLATIITYDCFYTDDRDSSKVKTSSYLDLAPLYGSSVEDQKRIRTFKDGLLKPDTFSEERLLGFPPGVAAIVICFNRYHNYVAMQLRTINEGGRFKIPRNENDIEGNLFLDENLFQTARLVTCGLYINIVLIDYVRTILNLNRTNSNWTLDLRGNKDVDGIEYVPRGIGNQVSVEFNLLHRWHSAISKRDEAWTNKLYEEIMGTSEFESLTETEAIRKLHTWIKAQGDDPSTWAIDNGKYMRNDLGRFADEDLVNILADATEDVAGAFGPRNVPVVMKLIETMGMQQARQWNVATLNELRAFFKLEPHRTFTHITRDEDTAAALKALYGHPDYVEMYPGLIAEDAKEFMEPGSGLCPGSTVSRAILVNAVALSRGDRYYTVDYTPADLTNWGFNQVKSDPDVAQGHCFYNLVMRALPSWYRGSSIYAMFPFTVPDENHRILAKLGTDDEYNFVRPSYIGVPASIKSWKAVTSILSDTGCFAVPWGPHMFDVTGHDYMLSGDKMANFQQRDVLGTHLYGHNFPDSQNSTVQRGRLSEVQKFYEDLTTQLVTVRSEILLKDWYQLDAVRDVGNPSHAIFNAKMWHIPLKGPDDVNPVGVTVEQLYLTLSVMFAYVFLDLDTARSIKLRLGAKRSVDALSKLIRIVCEAVRTDSYFHVSDLFRMGHTGKLLGDYGTRLLRKMFEGGKSVDEVVWTIIPTAAMATATQAQHFGQMIDLYLEEEYQHHWADIQKCAWSELEEDFEKLKGYALEANRLRPAAFGLLRKSRVERVIDDNGKRVMVNVGDQIYTDFVAAGMDEQVFPDPLAIDPYRNRDLYIHHGIGAHACLGRPIVEVAMAAQLKVFAKLKDLRRAPGMQGQMKRTVSVPNPVGSDPHDNPGRIEVFMQEDWSDWWPFPTSLKVHHAGFFESQEEYLESATGVPGHGE